MRAKVVAALLGIWVAGCRDGESPPEWEYRPDGYELALDASAAPAGGHLDMCSLRGHLALDSIPQVPWSLSTTASLRRTLIVINQTSLIAFDSLPRLSVEASYPATDSIVLMLAGPYADTLRGTYHGLMGGFPTYGGPWTCPPRFPRATDATLRAHGYDATAAIVGDWMLVPRLPMP